MFKEQAATPADVCKGTLCYGSRRHSKLFDIQLSKPSLYRHPSSLYSLLLLLFLLPFFLFFKYFSLVLMFVFVRSRLFVFWVLEDFD